METAGTPAAAVRGPASIHGRTRENLSPIAARTTPQYAEFCARCGKELPASDWASAAPPPAGAPVPPPYAPPASYGEYAPFRAPVYDAMGGIPIKEEIEDRVTAGEVAQTVGVNTAYYVPRFHRISRSGSKVSWNWFAFLITPCWLVYRKNFLTGGLTLLFWIARQLLSSFYLSAVYFSPACGRRQPLCRYAVRDRYPNAVSRHPPSSDRPGRRRARELLLRIFFGLFGNYFYMRNVIRKSKKWQTDPDARYHQNVFTSGASPSAWAPPRICAFSCHNTSCCFLRCSTFHANCGRRKGRYRVCRIIQIPSALSAGRHLARKTTWWCARSAGAASPRLLQAKRPLCIRGRPRHPPVDASGGLPRG